MCVLNSKVPLTALTASACGSFVQGLLPASVQVRFPDNSRGSVTGVMFAIRSIQIFAGIALTPWGISNFSVHAYLPVLGVLLVTALPVLRGFKCLDATGEHSVVQ
jgi:hypothetical protein